MSLAEQRRLPEAFIAADRKADLAALEGLCASDVVSYSDGGGVVRAARTPIAGRERVAKFIYCVRFTLLDRCHAHVDPNKWTVIGTDRARWCDSCRRDDRRLCGGHQSNPVDDETQQADRDFQTRTNQWWRKRDHRIDSTLSLRIYWSKYGTFRVAPGSRAIRNLSAPLS